MAKECHHLKGHVKPHQANHVKENQLVAMILKALMVDVADGWWVDSGVTCPNSAEECIQILQSHLR